MQFGHGVNLLFLIVVVDWSFSCGFSHLVVILFEGGSCFVDICRIGKLYAQHTSVLNNLQTEILIDLLILQNLSWYRILILIIVFISLGHHLVIHLSVHTVSRFESAIVDSGEESFKSARVD